MFILIVGNAIITVLRTTTHCLQQRRRVNLYSYFKVISLPKSPLMTRAVGASDIRTSKQSFNENDSCNRRIKWKCLIGTN